MNKTEKDLQSIKQNWDSWTANHRYRLIPYQIPYLKIKNSPVIHYYRAISVITGDRVRVIPLSLFIKRLLTVPL